VNAVSLITDRIFSPAEVANRNMWQHLGAIVLTLVGLAAANTQWGRRNFFDGYLAFMMTGPVMAVWSYRAASTETLLARPHSIVGGELIFFLLATVIIGNLGFVRSVIASVAYALAFQYVLLHVPRSESEARSLSVLFYLIAATCLLATFLADRRDRRLFMNEQLLLRERERAEHVLRADVTGLSGELQHQLAERARALTEALARLTDGPRAAVRWVAGDLIAERYRIVRRLGAGGMGEVHEVERITDARRFALKVLTGAADRAALARFAREAQIAAELEHPNVVPALDIGVTHDGVLFLVMELVAGMSLAADRSRYGDASWALPILAQLARAIDAMHARGIVHRDLKPANILLDGDIVKVTDFGLASLGSDAGAAAAVASPLASASLTQTGAIMGTPLYMAPELVHGARDAGPQTDMFSAGMIAFELLAKRLPYASPPVLARLDGREPEPADSLATAAPELRRELADIIDRCLAHAPGARPSAAELAAVLAE
ncbi:MAG TPA: serine/threonine-protein kinase, partial [Kofleriaceae bacterium]|nr:serine/threonine-protein kinase [Kofleriaceae bacterium]